MANVQIDDGKFTRIAHEILERIAKAKLNGTQYAIVLIIWRQTYGFGRTEHDFSQGYLAKQTGLDRHQIQRELAKLIDRHIITVVKEPTKSTPQVLKFNKDYDQWKVLAKTLTVSENANRVLAKTLTQPVSELANQVKKDIKENLKENNPPTPLPQKPTKKNYGEFQNVKLTDEEHSRLCADYGQAKTDQAVKFFDEYIEEKGYKSKSHNLAMRRWVFNAVEEQRNKGKPPPNMPRVYAGLKEWSEAE